MLIHKPANANLYNLENKFINTNNFTTENNMNFDEICQSEDIMKDLYGEFKLNE